jgi:hypothetical protein
MSFGTYSTDCLSLPKATKAKVSFVQDIILLNSTMAGLKVTALS